MPRIISSSSTRRNGGFLLRYSTIRCAVASPTPGKVFNSATVARLILICWNCAPVFAWSRLLGLGLAESFRPESTKLNTVAESRRQNEKAAAPIRARARDRALQYSLSGYTGLNPFGATPSPESFGECHEILSSRHE